MTEKKLYAIQDAVIELDDMLHAQINHLAHRFAKSMGFHVDPDYDFEGESRPKKARLIFHLALEAYVFYRRVGD